jgi:hypothetical protein
MTFENHEYYNCEIQLDSGETYTVSANWLHNQQLDQWQGWQCNAGNTRLMIDENFDIYSGECLNNYLGNLIAGWQLATKMVVCQQPRCSGCTDDLIVNKKAPQ